MRLPVLLFATLSACSSSSSDTGSTPAPAEWPGCRAMKSRLGDAADVVFAPPPAAVDAGSRWTVRFFELAIDVPEAEYQVSRHRDAGGVSAILKSDEHVIALIKDPPLEGQEDVFRVAGEPAGDEGTSATRAYFGKPPTAHDLALLGYQHTRADLTCAADRAADEQIVAAALALKTIAGPGELVSVHRDRTGLGDITHVRRTPEGWSWETRIPAADAYYTLSYQSKARGFLAVRRWAADSRETGPDALRGLGE